MASIADGLLTLLKLSLLLGPLIAAVVSGASYLDTAFDTMALLALWIFGIFDENVIRMKYGLAGEALMLV